MFFLLLECNCSLKSSSGNGIFFSQFFFLSSRVPQLEGCFISRRWLPNDIGKKGYCSIIITCNVEMKTRKFLSWQFDKIEKRYSRFLLSPSPDIPKVFRACFVAVKMFLYIISGANQISFSQEEMTGIIRDEKPLPLKPLPNATSLKILIRKA